jgi:lipopolysaccharide heptosyltransferase II
MTEPRKILIIQTASIGDVILATPVVESFSASFPGAAVDFLLKKGIEPLLAGHPNLRRVLTWDKNRNKLSELFKLTRIIRKEKYDIVVNAQRFLATGLLTAFSDAGIRVGFDKNPASFMFDKKVKHIIGRNGVHEIDRNLALVEGLVKEPIRRVKLYPSAGDFDRVANLKKTPYITVSPASLWFTKQFPEERWIEFIRQVDERLKIYLLGSQADAGLCQRIIQTSGRQSAEDLSGKLTMLQSAALMKDAVMNFVNDSAPMHFASSVNAPVTAIFCSTVPGFGFGPLSEDSAVVEIRSGLSCRPCGLHGYRECPQKHFKCASDINMNELINRIQYD